MSGDNEDNLASELMSHAKSLHDKIAASAAGADKPQPEMGESTARRAVKMFNQGEENGGTSEEGEIAPRDREQIRKAKVGQYFSKSK